MTLGAMLAFTGCSSPNGPGAGTPDPGATTPSDGSEATPATNEDGTVNNPESVEIDPNKLVFWSLFSGGDGEFMDKIIADYNATNPPKQVQSVMLVWADYYTKLATAVASGRGPDIGVSHMSKLPELVSKGIVQPINKYAEAAGTNWGDYPDNSLKGVTFDDERFAIPLDTHASIMYSNKKALAEAGVELNSDAQLTITSSEDLLAVLKKLKESVAEGVSPLAMPQQGDDPYRMWWATYFQMKGTPIVSDDGSTVTLDKATALKAAEFVNSLYTDGYVLPGIQDHQQMFQEGKAGLMFGGTWAVGAFEKTDGLDFTPQPFPSLFNDSEAGWADAHVLTIPTQKDRTEEETQASVDFINYVASKGGLTWASSGQIPANKTVTDDPAFAALPLRSEYMRAKETAILPPQTENFASLKDAMILNLDTIWSGQSEPTEAIDNMFDEMESELS